MDDDADLIEPMIHEDRLPGFESKLELVSRSCPLHRIGTTLFGLHR
jgi:hypothetical protein